MRTPRYIRRHEDRAAAMPPRNILRRVFRMPRQRHATHIRPYITIRRYAADEKAIRPLAAYATIRWLNAADADATAAVSHLRATTG